MTTQVTGTVFDEGGNLLANTVCTIKAKESLVGQDSGARTRRGVTVTTDGSGVFDADLKPGAYEITVAVPSSGSPSTISAMRGSMTVLDQASQTLQSALDSDISDITPSALQQALGTLVLEINEQTASYTLALTDASQMVEMNVASANTLTIPDEATVNFPIGTQIIVVQTGAGQTTIEGDAGVTVNSQLGLDLAEQWAPCALIKRASDSWIAMGDLT